MKMTGLHSFSHTTDDTEHDTCAICSHAVTHSLTATISPSVDNFHIINNLFVTEAKQTSDYSSIVANTLVTSELFSRPPPPLL
ncbi:hypothetical protein [Maribacter sp. Asnod1-A12]|uniref:hypothetical protein n=1 Tax=Maribacter sp. Asnod1-A12 TaxID=3160576 RepID=UPI003867390C